VILRRQWQNCNRDIEEGVGYGVLAMIVGFIRSAGTRGEAPAASALPAARRP
jgi:hypothetical protein